MAGRFFAIDDNIRRADILLDAEFAPSASGAAARARRRMRGSPRRNMRSGGKVCPVASGPIATLDEIKRAPTCGSWRRRFFDRPEMGVLPQRTAQAGQQRIVVCTPTRANRAPSGSRAADCQARSRFLSGHDGGCLCRRDAWLCLSAR